MASSARAWSAVCLFAWFGCFSESSQDDDDDDATSASASDPTSTSASTSTSTTSGMSTATSDPTSQTDPSLDGSSTTEGESTTDPTGACPAPGDAACNDTVAVVGELCFLEPEAKNGGDEQIGALAIADIDGDDVPDVAFADGADGFVSFVAGGEVQNASPSAGEMPTWSVDVGPLEDRIAVAFGGASAEVYVVRFDGMASTVDPPLAAPGIFATARFGDFDDDGRLDLVVGSDSSAMLYVHMNDGFGQFGGETSMLDVGPVSGITDLRVLVDDDFAYPGLAILTHDGRLIWTPPNDSGLGDFVEIDPMQTYGDPTTGRLAAGDLDADGDVDLAVGFDGRAFVFRASELGYMAPQSLGDAVVGNVVPTIADVDNDGLPDILLADPEETEIEIYVSVGDGFMEADPIQVPAMPRGVGVADFDEDCAADVVALGPAWFEVSQSNP
ncbi:MAG TPA: VCBS repeat-containing protein [Nannocystaceae bacterium]|nr:VCBS repeat-containing protein [Nannocystaceae bacterium]